MYSGPLSQRMTSGLPRQEMIYLSSRNTRSEGNEKSTSMPMASRLKSSITLNNLNVQPSACWSCMTSIDQTWLIPCGTVKTPALSLTSRLRGLNRKLSSSSLKIRYLNKEPLPLEKILLLTNLVLRYDHVEQTLFALCCPTFDIVFNRYSHFYFYFSTLV